MRSGTGPKRRVIRAFNVTPFESFLFNRSINPRGGSLARIKFQTNHKGRSRTKIFQDTNSDGQISHKEIIFHGKGRELYSNDELINFSGSVRLAKTMHKCEWLSKKFPGEQLICTREYIPTVYELSLISNNGKLYEFDGIGNFLDPIYK